MLLPHLPCYCLACPLHPPFLGQLMNMLLTACLTCRATASPVVPRPHLPCHGLPACRAMACLTCRAMAIEVKSMLKMVSG